MFQASICMCTMAHYVDLSLRSHSEQFSSNSVTVTLEWIILSSQTYYQQLLSNVSVSANPQLNKVMLTGNTSIRLVLSYNTLYNVSVTQHSTCRQLNQTQVLLLNYCKLLDYTLHIKSNVMNFTPCSQV